MQLHALQVIHSLTGCDVAGSCIEQRVQWTSIMDVCRNEYYSSHSHSLFSDLFLCVDLYIIRNHNSINQSHQTQPTCVVRRIIRSYSTANMWLWQYYKASVLTATDVLRTMCKQCCLSFSLGKSFPFPRFYPQYLLSWITISSPMRTHSHAHLYSDCSRLIDRSVLLLLADSKPKQIPIAHLWHFYDIITA